jgi:hypothetical protein
MTAVIDARALSALGYVVGTIRPQWDAPGIRSALEKALARHPYPDVALVAVSSARDPLAATPGVIPSRCANGWKANGADEVKPTTPTAPHLESLLCKRCGGIKPEGDDEHRENCGRRADPEQTAARIAEAKAAIAKPPVFIEPPERAVEDVELPEEIA